MNVSDNPHAIQITNASNWLKSAYEHFVFYSPNPGFLTFIKEHLIQTSRFSLESMNLKAYYSPFACILINTKTNELFLMRDHFGQEPFYYIVSSREPNHICFGSNLPDIGLHVKNLRKNETLISDTIMDVYTCCMAYTDSTYYQDVFRVTPGHIIVLTLNRRIGKRKHAYWVLEPGQQKLQYTSDNEYDEQFASLLKRAIRHCCKQSHEEIALEFSGGLDTASLLTTLHTENIPAQLFMHTHTQKPSEERVFGETLHQELQSNFPLYYIDADEFDPIQVLNTCKGWFSGGAPYLFFMLANNIHTATKRNGCKTLLSGFGGDECVSSHAPLRTYAAEIGFKKFWGMFQAEHKHHTKERLRALLLTQPHTWYGLQCIKACFTGVSKKYLSVRHKPYRSFQHREQDWLQGKYSYHIRMRVEYSAVVARQMGFRYQYPLLYPPLVEFCFSLPVEQKRRHNQNRLLMKRYLNKQVPSGLFNTHQKCGDILPATFDKCQKWYERGAFESLFQDLPYAKTREKMLRNNMLPEARHFHVDFLRYMFKD